VYQPTYTFETDAQCWHVDSSAGNTIPNTFSQVTTLAHTGSGSLQANVTYPTGQNKCQLEITLPSDVDMTGQMLTMWVYVDPALATSAAAQVFIQTHSTPTGSWDAVWNNVTAGGTWPPVTFIWPASPSGDPTKVFQFGVQIYSSAGTTGNVYVDDVVVSAVPTPTVTPTITATPSGTAQGFTFSSAASMTGWANNTGSTTAGGAVKVIYSSTYSSCSASTGAMEVTMGFTAINQAVFVQNTLGSATNMAGKTISVIMDVSSGWNSDGESIYGAIFVQENVSPWACVYQNGTGLWSAISTATDSGCVTLSLTMPASSAAVGSYTGYSVYNGTFDPTQVGIVGIQIGTGGGGTDFTQVPVLDVKSWLYQ
jgi:hypothetical protein